MQIRGSTVLPPPMMVHLKNHPVNGKLSWEKGAVISQLGGRSLRAVVEDGTDGPAGGPVDVRG